MGFKEAVLKQALGKSGDSVVKLLESIHAHLELIAELDKNMLKLQLEEQRKMSEEEAKNAVQAIIDKIVENND